MHGGEIDIQRVWLAVSSAAKRVSIVGTVTIIVIGIYCHYQLPIPCLRRLINASPLCRGSAANSRE